MANDPFRLTGDQIHDMTALVLLVDETLDEVRFDDDDPRGIHQESLELIQEEAEQLLRHLHDAAEQDRIFGRDTL